MLKLTPVQHLVVAAAAAAAAAAEAGAHLWAGWRRRETRTDSSRPEQVVGQVGDGSAGRAANHHVLTADVFPDDLHCAASVQTLCNSNDNNISNNDNETGHVANQHILTAEVFTDDLHCAAFFKTPQQQQQRQL